MAVKRPSVTCALGLLWANTASADASTTEEHRALVISAQVMQKESKLLRARDLLVSCSTNTCEDEPAECEEIRAFCSKRLAAVAAEIPTVQIRVVDDRGLPVHPEALEVDAVTRDPSKPLPLDPGSHSAKALYAGRMGEATFSLERGKQDASVVIHVDLRETIQRRPTPLPVYFLGAAALTTGIVSTATGAYTVSSYQGLSSCQPYCDPSRQGTLQATSYVADVSALVALTCTVAGVIWFLARPTVREVRWLHATTERTR
jgi:hypothetical protein